MLLVLLFFVIALGFSIYCFTKKVTLLSLLSGFLWFGFIIYTYPLSGGWDIYRILAAFGVIMAILSWILPLAWRPKLEPDDEHPHYENTEDIFDHLERDRTKNRKSEPEEEESEI